MKGFKEFIVESEDIFDTIEALNEDISWLKKYGNHHISDKIGTTGVKVDQVKKNIVTLIKKLRSDISKTNGEFKTEVLLDKLKRAEDMIYDMSSTWTYLKEPLREVERLIAELDRHFKDQNK